MVELSALSGKRRLTQINKPLDVYSGSSSRDIQAQRFRGDPGVRRWRLLPIVVTRFAALSASILAIRRSELVTGIAVIHQDN
jgi:hypothetical protein